MHNMHDKLLIAYRKDCPASMHYYLLGAYGSMPFERSVGIGPPIMEHMRFYTKHGMDRFFPALDPMVMAHQEVRTRVYDKSMAP